jgi:hypothetical protein
VTDLDKNQRLGQDRLEYYDFQQLLTFTDLNVYALFQSLCSKKWVQNMKDSHLNANVVNCSIGISLI